MGPFTCFFILFSGSVAGIVAYNLLRPGSIATFTAVFGGLTTSASMGGLLYGLDHLVKRLPQMNGPSTLAAQPWP